LCIISVACTREAQNSGGHEGKSLRHAYSLLNQSREDEALALADTYLLKNPKSTSWLTVKAEAYVSQAGLRANSLIQLARKLDSLSQLDTSLHKKAQLDFIREMKKSSDQSIQNMANVFTEFLNLLDNLSLIYVSFNAISDIPMEKISLLAKASVILTQVSPLTDDIRIFKVIVNLLILKFKLKYNYYFYETADCLTIDKINSKLEELNFDLLTITQDLNALYPDNKSFTHFSMLDPGIDLKNITSSWKTKESVSTELIITLFQHIGLNEAINNKKAVICP
jgi:hypothetical protein